jgi:hypothetical protein
MATKTNQTSAEVVAHDAIPLISFMRLIMYKDDTGECYWQESLAVIQASEAKIVGGVDCRLFWPFSANHLGP